MTENNLIFLVSLPRSGSTYLQSLLSNNEEVNTCSETWILLYFANQLKSSLIRGSFNNNLAVEAFQDYERKFPDYDFDQLKKEFLLRFYTPLYGNHKWIIDKTPRYWQMLPEIRSLFPQSRIIVVKRNPLDVATSIFKTWNVKNVDELSYYQEDLLYGPRALHSFEQKYYKNSNTYFLKYEDLVKDVRLEVEKLYNWLNITFSHTTLSTVGNHKFKGKFGDPFLNSNEGYTAAKERAYNKELTVFQRKFLKGYAHYLGEDFLSEYGDYEGNTVAAHRTLVFSHFLYMCNPNNRKSNIKKGMRMSLKEKIYRIVANYSLLLESKFRK